MIDNDSKLNWATTKCKA